MRRSICICATKNRLPLMFDDLVGVLLALRQRRSARSSRRLKQRLGDRWSTADRVPPLL
jgi:hypothetical protein